MVGIYKFTNRIDGKSYIGQSVNIHKRYIQHKNRFDHDNIKLEDTFFHRMLRHYGFENFDFEILEECSVSELNQREIYYIQKHKTYYPFGYNMTKGGNDVVCKKIDKLRLNNIINDLRFSDLTEIDIAKKYGVILNTISLINQGKMWFDENESYPIRKISKKKYYCKECGKEKTYYSKNGLCKSCTAKRQRKCNRPCKTELIELLNNNSFEKVGKLFGVSGNAVRKWCDGYNLPRSAEHYNISKSNN